MKKLIVAMAVGAAALLSVSAANAANQKGLTEVAQFSTGSNLNIGTMDTLMVVSTMATAIIGTMANLAIVITISKGATATLPSIMAAAMVGQVTVEDMVMVGRA
jgi:hypothetical protein